MAFRDIFPLSFLSSISSIFCPWLSSQDQSQYHQRGLERSLGLVPANLGSTLGTVSSLPFMSQGAITYLLWPSVFFLRKMGYRIFILPGHCKNWKDNMLKWIALLFQRDGHCYVRNNETVFWTGWEERSFSLSWLLLRKRGKWLWEK